MDIAGFHDLVAEDLNEAADYSSRIVSATRQAVRWMERNNNFFYMRVAQSVDVPVGGQMIFSPRTKRIDIFKILLETVDDEDRYKILPRKRDYDFEIESEGEPEFYVQRSPYLAYAYPKPIREYDGLAIGYMYTDWDALATTATHWLIDNGEDALLARTLLYLAPILKDREMVVDYREMLQESLVTLLNADDEHRILAPNEEERMQYEGGA